ncbi:MAG: bifunctional (p)ppGpp synthetase/guanosine-3',5'-bis(diphosphate) 3'-pyrophosphohydrolase [Chloroflexi bacterium]|nr:MAG: bifunctional (p)ppGpp synthetase/guanosine-3',5'-bis(diphosphate) 3'-pyrophosphohydrolase [Chloroflexota bacterium]
MTKVLEEDLAGLINSLSKELTGSEKQKVRSAYVFAKEAHGTAVRESGESYFSHSLAVAHIMAELGVDTDAIISALLHDILEEHTGKTVQEIEEQFGAVVARRVDTLHNFFARKSDRLSRGGIKNDSEADQSKTRAKRENILRPILAIIEEDIIVGLIIMADSLQNLRKASNLPKERQMELAELAMEIYAPLANRLGVWQLKWELEDLAFRYLEPDKYKDIARKLASRRAERNEKIRRAKAKLEEKIKRLGLKATITGRPKHIYSIYRKMQRKEVDLDQIYDVQALRVILEPRDPEAYARMDVREKENEDRRMCYLVLAEVHDLWKPIPHEFDDYIAAPKPNGYQSLHTAVIDPETGETLEVQIRTRRMHEEAEKGVAAHWAYKETDTHVSGGQKRRIQNIRKLLEEILHADNSSPTKEEEVGSEVLAERIYVYTPKGDVIDLPVGATPIDFAYSIHTNVGHHCRGAKVNGRIVPLDYKLKSGDQVEILTAKRGGPSRDWLNPSLGYTGSARTRSKIRQWFRQQEREQNIRQGREVVERELRRLGLQDTYTIEDIAHALKYDNEEEFLAKVGFGDIHSAQINGAIAAMQQKLKPDDELRPLLTTPPSSSSGFTIHGLGGIQTRIAGCCKPIPPEPISGYITRGHGVTIHRRDCKQLKNVSDRDRIIEKLEWRTEDETYPVPVVIKAYRRPDLIEDIVRTLQKLKINAPKAKTTTANSITTVYMVVEIVSLDQLNQLLQKLESLPNVFEAYRQRWG